MPHCRYSTRTLPSSRSHYTPLEGRSHGRCEMNSFPRLTSVWNFTCYNPSQSCASSRSNPFPHEVYPSVILFGIRSTDGPLSFYPASDVQVANRVLLQVFLSIRSLVPHCLTFFHNHPFPLPRATCRLKLFFRKDLPVCFMIDHDARCLLPAYRLTVFH